MAEQMSLADQLRSIVKTEIHSTYRQAIEKDVALCKSLARLLIELDVNTRLPPGQTTPAHERRDPSKSTMRLWINEALEYTMAVKNALDVLSREPADSNQRVGNQTNFGANVKGFFENWNFLLPALEAGSGDLFADKAQKQAAEIEHLHKRATETLTAMQDAAGKIGASRHAKAFSDLSNSYARKAIYWLVLTIVVAGLLVYGIVRTTSWATDAGNDHPKLAQVIIERILLVTVFYYLFVLAARTYRANAHLAAVNRHRGTALQTFETFVNAPTNDETRNAILLETSRCIYAHTSTGFLGVEEPSGPTQIVEILKAIGSPRN